MAPYSLLYYVFYVLSGGFRHYGFDLAFSQALLGSTVSDPSAVIDSAERFLLVMALILIAFPNWKYVHLTFFALLQLLDLYFQNHVGFMSCFILPHLVPLFFFLFLHLDGREGGRSTVAYTGMLTVSIGYLAALIGKVDSGWLNMSVPVVHSYVQEFSIGYGIPSTLAQWTLQHFGHLIWKSLDYAVLAFQLSFALVFIRPLWFNPISVIAVIFHMCILLILGIGVVFYTYILFYSLVIRYSEDKGVMVPALKGSWIRIASVVASMLLTLSFTFFGLDVHFFNNLLTVGAYVRVEYIYASICTLLYTYTLWTVNPALPWAPPSRSVD